MRVDRVDERLDTMRVLLVHKEQVLGEVVAQRAAQFVAQVRVVLHVDAGVEGHRWYDIANGIEAKRREITRLRSV